MKSRANACIRIFFIFLAAYLAITIGCSGGGGHSIVQDIEEDTPAILANKLLERSLEATSPVELVTSDGILTIGLSAGSFSNRSKITVFSYQAGVASTTLPTDNFIALSSLYNITFVDETAQSANSLRAALGIAAPSLVNFLLSPAEVTFRIPTIENNLNNCYIAYTNSSDNWQLIPVEVSGTVFKFKINNVNGKFLLVRNYTEYEGSLEKAMEFELDRSIVTASASEIIEKNIEVSLILQTNSNFEPTSTNSELDISFVGQTAFDFDVIKSASSTTKINASALNQGTDGLYTSNRVSLFDYAEKTITGNKYTYSFLLGIKGKLMEDLPSYLLIKAKYITKEGIGNSSEQLVFFTRLEEPLNVISVTPAQNSIILPMGQEFTITFNRDMDKELTAGGVSLINSVSSETTLLSNYKWNSERILVASSSNQLEFNRNYILAVENAVTADGITSTASFTYNYVTATQSSNFELITPAANENVATMTNFVVSFARNMKTETFVDDNFKVLAKDGSNNELNVTVSEFTDTTVTLNLVNALNYNTQYCVYISNNVYDSDNSPFLASETRVFTTIAQPVINSIVPEPGVISGSSNFNITFNRAMKPSSTSNDNAISLMKNGTENIECSYLWQNSDMTVVITPNNPLANSASYTLTLAEGLRDNLGNEFANTSYEYSVSEITTVESILPNTGAIATNTVFNVVFSKKVSDSISGADFELFNTTTEDTIPCNATIESNITQGIVKVTPQVAMDYGATYRFTVKNTAKDSDNMFVQESSIIVTTDVQPTVVSVTDNAGTAINSNEVNVNTVFKVTFSKQMNTSLTENAFGIYEFNGFSEENQVVGNFSAWENTNKTLIFTPNSALKFGQRYILKVASNGCDSSSNTIATYSYDFVTKNQAFVSDIVFAPTRNEPTLATSTVLTVKYTEDLDPLTVIAANVYITDLTTSNLIDCNLNYLSKSITVTPNAPLDYAHNYRLTLTGNVHDTFGQKTAIRNYNFTTDSQPTMVITPDVWNDASPAIWHTDNMVLTFDKEMVTTGAIDALLTVTPNVTYEAVWDIENKIATITFNWSVGSVYNVVLNDGAVKDKFGNPVSITYNKNVTVKSGVSFADITLKNISDVSLTVKSATIAKNNGSEFIEGGFYSYPVNDVASISTHTIDIPNNGVLSNVDLDGFNASTSYKLVSYAIYSDHNGNPCMECGTEKMVQFSTNPLPGGEAKDGYNYLVSTEDNPYEVSTPRHLILVGNHERAPLNGYYKQTAAINMDHNSIKTLITSETDLAEFYNSTAGFKPIGSSVNPFTGIYNGSNYAIENLYINRSGEDYVGLFASIADEAKLNNILLKDFEIKGKDYVAAIAASQIIGTQGASISSCTAILDNYTSYGGVYGDSYVGGIMGYSNKTITIEKSTFGGLVKSSYAEPEYVGGIAAYVTNSSIIKNCNIIGYGSNSYSKIVCDDESNTPYTMYVGGLVGYAEATVTNCANINVYIDMNSYWTCYGGALIGFAKDSNISNCQVQGNTVSCMRSGALIGKMSGTSLLKLCNSNVNTTEKSVDPALKCLVYEKDITSTVVAYGEADGNHCLYTGVGDDDCIFK